SIFSGRLRIGLRTMRLVIRHDDENATVAVHVAAATARALRLGLAFACALRVLWPRRTLPVQTHSDQENRRAASLSAHPGARRRNREEPRFLLQEAGPRRGPTDRKRGRPLYPHFPGGAR